MTVTMQKIKNAMNVCGMTQRELSQKTEISEPVISRLMNGNKEPSISQVEKMCNALNVEIKLYQVAKREVEI